MTAVQKLHLLDCGALSMGLEQLLPQPQLSERATREATPERFACTPHAVLVETHEGRILWDTSCPRNWQSYWPTDLQQSMPYDQVDETQYLDARLGQLGFAPSDIDFVVLSHLHFDHAGNAQMFADTGARIITQQAEREYAHDFDSAFEHMHFKPDYAGLDLETVDGDFELIPGVEFVVLPGHTPGTMAMKVRCGHEGTMIFTSDAVFLEENFGPPAAVPPHVVDPVNWLASVEKLRSVAAEDDAKLVFGHDSTQLRSLRLSPTAYYD